jgi:hypothetical protein
MTLICAEIFTIRAIKIKNDFEKIARTFQTSTLVQRPRSPKDKVLIKNCKVGIDLQEKLQKNYYVFKAALMGKFRMKVTLCIFTE